MYIATCMRLYGRICVLYNLHVFVGLYRLRYVHMYVWGERVGRSVCQFAILSISANSVSRALQVAYAGLYCFFLCQRFGFE